jgi:uncharacterized protein
MKFLLLLVVIAVAVWWVSARRPRSPGTRAPAAPPPATPATMVACAHCGLHLPQAEALADAGGRLYCSAAHRGAGPR